MLKPTPNVTSERVYGLLLGAIYGEWRGRYTLGHTVSPTIPELAPQASQIWPQLEQASAAIKSLANLPVEPRGQRDPDNLAFTTASLGSVLPALVLYVDPWEIHTPRLAAYCAQLQTDALTTTFIQATGTILNAIWQPDAPTVPTKTHLQQVLTTQLTQEPMAISAADLLADLQQIQALDTLWLLQHSSLLKAPNSAWQRDFYLAYYALTAAPRSLEAAIQLIERGLGQRSPIANSLVGTWFGAAHGPKVIPSVWQINLNQTWQAAIAATAQHLTNLWSGHLNLEP
ncbi:MAG: hypothetical protein AAGF24_02615 [Cyanobacteria bacterium P01_H01_bin.121]